MGEVQSGQGHHELAADNITLGINNATNCLGHFDTFAGQNVDLICLLYQPLIKAKSRLTVTEIQCRPPCTTVPHL